MPHLHVAVMEQLQSIEPEPCALMEQDAFATAEGSNLASSGHHQYVGLRAVGRGGMGTVFLAAHSSTKKIVAIKAIKKDLKANLEGIRRETQVLAMVGDHPFLPRLHSQFESERHAFLVMDYCAGGDLNALRQRQPEKRLSEEAIRFYAAELVLALEHLHGLGVVYRDLKPENVLISDAGHVVLTDFDLSLLLSSGQKAKAAGPDQHAESDQKYEAADSDCSSCSSRRADSNVESSASNNFNGGRRPNLKRGQAFRFLSCLTGAAARRSAAAEVGRPDQAAPPKLTKLSCKKARTVVNRKLRGWKCRVAAAEHTILDAAAGGGGVSGVAPPRQRQRYRRHFVGTEEYVAPEVIRGEGYSRAGDWWALGVVLYELVCGRTPFKGRDRRNTFCNIVREEVAPVPAGPDDALRDLVRRLLNKDPRQRLAGAQQVKAHPFFQGVQWHLLHLISRPPFLPPPPMTSSATYYSPHDDRHASATLDGFLDMVLAPATPNSFSCTSSSSAVAAASWSASITRLSHQDSL